MKVHGTMALLRGKKGILANLLFQVATLTSQALLIWSCLLFFDTRQFDELFLTAAYITPVYTLLLFGGRQLVLSEKMSERHLLIFRTAGLVVLFGLAALIINFVPRIGLQVVVAAFGWKLFEYVLDGICVLCQHRSDYRLLNILSFSRVVVFAIPFTLDASYFTHYLIMLTAAVCALQLLTLRRAWTNTSKRAGVPFKLPLQLGAVALVSALVVSIPRMVLGDSSRVSAGVLGFLGVFSYCYLGGQLLVNSIVPYAIGSFRKMDRRELVVGKIRALVAYAFMAIATAFFVFGLGLYWVAPNFEALRSFRYLIPWATLIAPLALLANLIEPFSSLLDSEKRVLTSLVVTLGVALIGSWLLVEKGDGIGYCIALATAFLVRAVISGWMLLKSHPKRFGPGNLRSST